MVAKFCQFIASEHLFTTNDRLLVAVSGGLDSTALVHLLAKGGFTFGMAHCNFHLRGTESDGDAKFVRELANELGVPFFAASLPVDDLRKAGESVQMCARRLRYEWLRETLKQESYTYLLTAHHLYDSLESMLINFTRGTGLAGMQGIPLRTGLLRRPLLFCARPQLAAWVEEETIDYREDTSNAEDKYQRNRIRHHVLPILEEMNPAFAETLFRNFSHLKAAYFFYQQSLDKQISLMRKQIAEEVWQIDRSFLREHPEAPTLLYACLDPFGFQADQSHQLLSAKTGTILQNGSYEVLVDQQYLWIRAQTIEDDLQVEVSAEDKQVSLPNGRTLKISLSGIPDHFSGNRQEVWVEQAKLIYPLTLRYWQAGDEFQPLGMAGKHQKLQDFFVNNKINRFDRQVQPLLFNGNGELIWIIGHRLDERYKITESTQTAIQLSVD